MLTINFYAQLHMNEFLIATKKKKLCHNNNNELCENVVRISGAGGGKARATKHLEANNFETYLKSIYLITGQFE